MAGGDECQTTDLMLKRLADGDQSARAALLQHAMQRLKILATAQLRGFPAVARWEDSDDVVQGVAQRLHRALSSVRPENTREFYQFCSALIRRELIDLKRHLFGQRGVGAAHASPPPDGSAGGVEAANSTYDPHKLARWTELHARVADLPDPLREVFDLLWYQGLTHQQAADTLGVAVKTISRRWREARLQLHDLFDPDEQ